jgi:hypothetical protein
VFLFTVEQTGFLYRAKGRDWLQIRSGIHVLGIGELSVISGGSYEFGSVC